MLSTACAIPLIFSTFSNCSANRNYGIIFVGPAESGKTHIINAIGSESFDLKKYQPTLGIDFLKLNKKVELWDTGGAERFKPYGLLLS